jgi:uncharacterized protein YfaP (DUF2135 family)
VGAGALRVELAFGAEADLDLYVSDPSAETAYFANTPVRSGGALAADLRCDARPPRVEVAVWESPAPGRYRVGVDFPERCSSGVDTAPFELRVRGPGVSRELRGEAAFGRFDSRVLEFEIAP